MKVLIINSVTGYGSTGRIALDTAHALTARGDNTLIAFGRVFGGIPEGSRLIASPLSVKVHGLLTRAFDLHGFGSYFDTMKAVKLFEEFDPDVIQLHQVHGYYINMPLLFRWFRQCGKPVVWTLHDCWALTGHCAHYDYIGCGRFMTGCHDCPQKGQYPASFIDGSRRNYERKKELFCSVPNLTLVTPSKWLAGEVKKSYLKNLPTEVIYNGIDLETFSHTDSGIKQRLGLEDKRIVLAVANVWESRKGYEDVLELARTLPDEFRVVMVGLDAGQLEALPGFVTGITRTKDAHELAGLYSAAEVLFNPTKEETLGLTNIEALACGTPVVAYSSGGCPETLDESCGFVVKRDDIKSAADIIISGKCLKISPEVCRTRAEGFSNEAQCRNYLALYDKLYQ